MYLSDCGPKPKHLIPNITQPLQIRSPEKLIYPVAEASRILDLLTMFEKLRPNFRLLALSSYAHRAMQHTQ